MNRIVGICILVVGVVLLCWGYRESESVASGFSRIFHDSPTDKSMGLMIVGGILSVAGAGVILRRPRKKS